MLYARRAIQTGTWYLLLLMATAPANGNEVAAAVSEMSAGEWRQIEPETVTGEPMSTYLYDASDRINTWIDSMGYDPASQCLLAAANAHGGDKYLVEYCLQNNTVSKTLIPQMSGGHAYDQNAFCDGKLYYLNKGTMWVYSPGSGDWSGNSLSVEHKFGSAIACMPGEAIYITGPLLSGATGRLYKFPLVGSDVTLVRSGLDLPKDRQAAEYVPAADVIIFGGGKETTAVYRLERNEAVTRVQDSPLPMILTDAFAGSMNFADPQTPHLYSAQRNGQVYRYDVGADSWSYIGDHGVEVYANGCASVASLGAVVCLSTRQNAVWVYKTGDSDITIPRPPEVL